MRKHRLLYIAVFFLISFLFGFDWKCDDKKKDPIKLLVTCNTAFTGSYIYNSADPVGFGGPTPPNEFTISGSLYYYSVIFDDLDNLSVDASITRGGGDTASYTLTIRIFKDDTEVKIQSINSAASGVTDQITNFTYTYDETATTP